MILPNVAPLLPGPKYNSDKLPMCGHPVCDGIVWILYVMEHEIAGNAKNAKKVSPSLSLMSEQNVRLAECIMMVCNGTRWHSIVPIPSTLQATVSLYGFYTGNFEPPKQPLKNANFETKSGRCDARRYLSVSAGLSRSAYFLATYIHNFHHLYKNRQWVDKN